MLRTSRTLPSTLALTFASLLSAHGLPAPACPASPVMDHGQATNGKPLASPPATAHVNLSGKTLTVKYNAPSIRCRKIMGGLVPYGQVWRTGANPATSFKTDSDLTIGTLQVPAGEYTLYTLPAAPGTPWQLIVSKQTGQWGTEYHEDRDLGRTPMHEDKLPTAQEVMSISFEKTSGNATQLHVRWENVDEWVEVKAAR